MYRVLVVDDEQNIRNVICEYAQFHGWETVQAQDGMEAVEIARREDFDVIVMDIMMPLLC